jgi:hypothetical protein
MASSKRQAMDAKAKAKKQKLIAIVGGVLLLAILAYEIPNTMKMLKQTNGQASSSSSQPAAATTTTTASATPAPGTAPADGSLTPPTLSGSAPASTPTSSSGLVNSDPAPTPSDGQLAKLDQFVATDPFKQQLAVTGGPSSSSGGDSGSGSDKTSTTPDGSAVPPSDGATSGSGSSGTGGAVPTPPVANPTTATISVNGVSEDVQAGGTFPKSAPQPYFRLVSLGASAVKIGVADGTLAGGGDQTVTLAKGKKLTLMNTADGTKYVLQLVALK